MYLFCRAQRKRNLNLPTEAVSWTVAPDDLKELTGKRRRRNVMRDELIYGSLMSIIVNNTGAAAIQLVCPICGDGLDPLAEPISCPGCHHAFADDDGIPLLFWQNDWPPANLTSHRQCRRFMRRRPSPTMMNWTTDRPCRKKRAAASLRSSLTNKSRSVHRFSRLAAAPDN